MKNILLIQVDQMNHRCFGAMGHPQISTPHLDALAEAGVLFTNARCNNPICLPSRVSMLSGRYPSSLKQFGFTGLCQARERWMPGYFRDAGYETAAIGKLHALSIGWNEWPFDFTAPTLPEDQDFATGEKQSYTRYCQDRAIRFPHDQIHGHDPFGPQGYYSSASGEEQPRMLRQSAHSDVPLEDSLETWTTDRGIDFLRSCADTGRPFFTWLSYDRPHFPTTLPDPWHERALELSHRLELPSAPDAEIIRKLPPSIRQDYEEGTSRRHLGDDDFRTIIATYYTLIEWIDAEIGRILAVLRQTGLDEDTTIVFTSDHGDEAGYRGLYNKNNGIASEEITRVPLIIRPAPSLLLARHGRSDSPCELLDIFPTLCKLHGLTPLANLDGQSLYEDLRVGTASVVPDRSVVCEDYHSRSLVNGDWKLVFDKNPAQRQLYYLADDPFCLCNLYTDPRNKKQRAESKRRLIEFMCQRLFGDYTEADVRNIKTRLQAPPEKIGLCRSPHPTLDYFRCAVFIRDADHELFIPFFDDQLLLFQRKKDWTDQYRRAKEAIPLIPAIVQQLLDDALHQLFSWVPSISLFRLPKTSVPQDAEVENDPATTASGNSP